jgi:hypothetical protein
MPRVEDLTGQRFGKLVVKRLVGKDKYYNKIWECECDCGNISNVRQRHLRSGHTTSCGCNKNNILDLTGVRFNHLVVKQRAEDYICPGNGKHYVQWRCVCDCGNETVVLANNLIRNSTISCGCKNPHKLKDLTGCVFGKLTVEKLIEPYINPSGRKLIQYECVCECGNHISALANTLRSGDVTSCGYSVNSKGEHIVSEWLSNHNFEFVLHKSFDDCVSDIGYKLNFDFYLPLSNILIECNGIQHYEAVDFFGGQNNLNFRKDMIQLKKNML